MSYVGMAKVTGAAVASGALTNAVGTWGGGLGGIAAVVALYYIARAKSEKKVDETFERGRRSRDEEFARLTDDLTQSRQSARDWRREAQQRREGRNQ